MKIILFISTILFSTVVFSQENKKVLFLGNSYTGVNNLPQMVFDLAASAGDNLTFDSNTPGGTTLNDHSTNPVSLQKIQAGDWDFVVLQEQSQIPSFPLGQVQADCFPYAAILDSLIRESNSCTETMFYMTWGRENGDASNCAGWPPVCTYEGMDDLLRQRYDQMAVDNHGVLSPVGALWRYIRQNNPGIQLYASDESHPVVAGSYAAACSFYSTIFRKDPTLISDDYGLPAAEALAIRNAAKAVVFDSLLTWHIGEYDPVSSFNTTSSFLVASFTNTSTNACSYLWDFGDGNTSTQLNPSHIFSPNITYTITLTAECCGFSDTATGTVNIFVGLEENVKAFSLEFSPNPAKDFVNIQIVNADEIYLINMKGQKVEVPIVKDDKTYTIDVSKIQAGSYFVKVIKEGNIYSGKFLKE